MFNFLRKFFLKESEIIKNNTKEIDFGDVILVRFPFITNPLAWLFQRIFKEKYFHAALYMGDNCIFEASGKGLVYNSLSSYKYCEIAVVRLREDFTCNEMNDIISEISMLYKPGSNKKGFMSKLWNMLKVKMGFERLYARTFDLDFPSVLFCTKLVAYLLRNKSLTNIDYSQVLCSDFLKFSTVKVLMEDRSK